MQTILTFQTGCPRDSCGSPTQGQGAFQANLAERQFVFHAEPLKAAQCSQNLQHAKQLSHTFALVGQAQIIQKLCKDTKTGPAG
jgi:hypothetical protein